MIVAEEQLGEGLKKLPRPHRKWWSGSFTEDAGVSDIHLQTDGNGTAVSFRLDGMMSPVMHLSADIADRVWPDQIPRAAEDLSGIAAPGWAY